MSRYTQNDDQMWGHYDFVDHGHDNAKLMPSAPVSGIGDYETMRAFGQSMTTNLDAPKVAAAGVPVVRGVLQYVEPNSASLILQGLRMTSFAPSSDEQKDPVYGTVVPSIPTGGPSWAEAEAAQGGMVAVEVQPKNPLEPVFVLSNDPATIREIAKPGSAFAVVAISPAMEYEANQTAAVQLDRGGYNPTVSDASEVSTASAVSKKNMLLYGLGGAALLGFVFYLTRRESRS